MDKNSWPVMFKLYGTCTRGVGGYDGYGEGNGNHGVALLFADSPLGKSFAHGTRPHKTMKTTFSNIHFSDVRKVRNASLPAVPSTSIHTGNLKKNGELRRKRSEYVHTYKWHNTWYWAMRGTDTNTRHRRTEARTVTVNPFELATPLCPDTIAEEAEL